MDDPQFCPPHYWLIEGRGIVRQHWTCKRCGLEREHREEQDASQYRGSLPRRGVRLPSK
jgi:hypothetical protein